MRIAVIDDYQGIAKELADWSAIPGAEVGFFHEAIAPAEMPARLGGFDVIQTMRERSRLPAEVLRQLPQLKLISGTVNYVNQTFSLFQEAEERRPAKLVTPKKS